MKENIKLKDVHYQMKMEKAEKVPRTFFTSALCRATVYGKCKIGRQFPQLQNITVLPEEEKIMHCTCYKATYIADQ